MNTRASELQTTRGRFFFWIGLVILPVFWVWWMRPACFSRTQRWVGWVWTGCYVVTLILLRGMLAGHLEGLMFSYPVVALRLGVALWLWLIFRTLSVWQIVCGFIVSIDIIAILASLVVPVLTMTGPSLLYWVFPLIPAVAHLLVEPVRRWQRRSIIGTGGESR